ncbi:hypothetical protein [Pseudomonas fluorescens]|nr:hypothetical protein [Pseudomonas fluorescens]
MVAQLAGYIEGLAASDITGEKADRLNDLMVELEGGDSLASGLASSRAGSLPQWT